MNPWGATEGALRHVVAPRDFSGGQEMHTGCLLGRHVVSGPGGDDAQWTSKALKDGIQCA